MSDSDGEDVTQIGPTLPSELVASIGPALPPARLSNSVVNCQLSEPKFNNIGIGPVFPSKLQAGSSQTSPDSEDSSADSEEEDEEVQAMGPMPPPKPNYLSHQSSDSDSDIIGPLPARPGESRGLSVAEEMERRAEKMKKRLEGKDTEEEKVPERETWMLELPEVMRKEYGLTKKTAFRKGPGVGDQSVWTDTPSDKERKAKGGEKRKRSPDFGRTERDKRMEDAITKVNEGRSESLLELHRKKLKKAEKKAKKAKEKEKKRRKKDKKNRKSSPPAARVPFDRDRDLKVNQFDNAKKEAYLKQTQGLSNKFSHGKQKFV